MTGRNGLLTPELRFAVLGPLGAWRGNEEVGLGAPQQRAVLATLLFASGRQVPLDALVDAVWDEPPRAASGIVRTYVSRLRRCLGGPGRGHEVIASAGDGYVLSHPPGAVDVDVFTRLTKEARVARNGRAGLRAASTLLQEATSLWRGEPLAGVPGPYADSKRVSLTELRMTTVEERLAIDIDLGAHAAAVAELQELTVRQPLRERLRELLMLALYRAGRQADALAVFTGTQHLLRDQLGIDPGPGLREIHQRILRMDEGLLMSPAGPRHAAVASDPRPPDPVVRPAQLPADVAAFTGRRRELAQLYSAFGQAGDPLMPVAVAAIEGMAGVGKTALAVHWAHQVADQFPDGQLYADLRGAGPRGPVVSSADALVGFLQALGVSPGHVPVDHEARVGLYRSLLNNRRMLILLDNAHDVEQVRPLIPGSRHSMVIVTSRVRMTGLIATYNALPLPLMPFPDSDARDALARRLDPLRAAAEPQAVGELARMCAGLPLALGIVAARAAASPDLALADVVEELRDPGDRLNALSTGDPATDVRTAFCASYAPLSLPARRLLRLAATLTGRRFSVAMAATLVGLPTAKIRPLLQDLTACHMLIEESPGWYVFHDLVLLFVAGLSGADGPASQVGSAGPPAVFQEKVGLVPSTVVTCS
jgi:DNA-binding SARP family transcriptional activator